MSLAEAKQSIKNSKYQAGFLAHAEEVVRQEGIRPNYWDYYGRTLEEYEDDLGLKKGELYTIVSRYKKQGLPLRVVDLMADTSCIGSMGGVGVAVALFDGRSPVRRQEDTATSRSMVQGNVLDRKTWKSLNTILSGSAIGRADVVLQAGCGGVEYLPREDIAVWSLVNRAFSLLDPAGGVMCLEMFADDRLRQKAASYADFLNSQNVGIFSYTKGSAFFVETQQNAPRILPAFK